MALTDIARQLKELFSGFGSSSVNPAELEKFRNKYGDVETIRIGEMDYVVIDKKYESVDSENEAQNVSPLFYNSIKNKYAIIDVETSSTLIDEVYSRITYIQRVCKLDTTPKPVEMRESLKGLVGSDTTLDDIQVYEKSATANNDAQIFECQLVKDTGVSATPDSYSFILKDGEVKEIPSKVMLQIGRSDNGKVNILKDHEDLDKNRGEIQKAVFEKYSKADMDIQSVTVKSIFEICLTFTNIGLKLKDALGRKGEFHTTYLASDNNEFEALNANIHNCNSCKTELVDVNDITHVRRLHLNTDACDEKDEHAYAVGCEECLEQCPDCGGWHFNYKKFLYSDVYQNVKLRPGREFIKGLTEIEGNYCSCREGIEWVYDDKSGDEKEHNVIFIDKMVFINNANEKIASYEDFKKYYDVEREKRVKELSKRKKELKGVEESAFAKEVIASFRRRLASKYDINVKDIKITSSDKCVRCNTCNCEYFIGEQGVNYDYDYRCEICDEMISERRRMVTRIDGMVFMRRVAGKKQIINKYVMTKFGNLKKVSSFVQDLNVGVANGAEELEEVPQDLTDEMLEAAAAEDENATANQE